MSRKLLSIKIEIVQGLCNPLSTLNFQAVNVFVIFIHNKVFILERYFDIQLNFPFLKRIYQATTIKPSDLPSTSRKTGYFALPFL